MALLDSICKWEREMAGENDKEDVESSCSLLGWILPSKRTWGTGCLVEDLRLQGLTQGRDILCPLTSPCDHHCPCEWDQCLKSPTGLMGHSCFDSNIQANVLKVKSDQPTQRLQPKPEALRACLLAWNIWNIEKLNRQNFLVK